MKKIIIIALLIITSLTLIACNSSFTSRATISNSTVELTGTSVSFRISLINSDDELNEATIDLRLHGPQFDETQTNDFFAQTRRFTFTELQPDTVYTLNVTATLPGGQNFVLITRTFTTLAVGDAEDTPILISTVEDFLAIPDNPEAYFRQTQDIDFAGAQLTPLFNANLRFRGQYDGDGFTLRNINITAEATLRNAAYLSVFGFIRDGAIRNLTLDGVVIDNTAAPENVALYVGILASRIDDQRAEIDNITIKNSTINIAHNLRVENDNLVPVAVNRSLYVGTVIGATHGTITNIVVENTTVDVQLGNVMPGLTSVAGTYIGGAIGLVEQNRGMSFENLDIDVAVNVVANITANNNNSMLAIGGIFGAHRGMSANNAPAVVGAIARGSVEVDITFPSVGADQSWPYNNLWTYIGGFIGWIDVQQATRDIVAYNDVFVNSNANQLSTSGETLQVGALIGRSLQSGNVTDRMVSVGQTVEVNAVNLTNSLVELVNYGLTQTEARIALIGTTLTFNSNVVTSNFRVINLEYLTTFIQNEWVLERL